MLLNNMKHLLFALLVIIYFPLNIQGQPRENVDSIEFGRITPNEFCALFSDSVLLKLTRYVYLGNSNYTYDELLLIALAWNSLEVNIKKYSKRESLEIFPCIVHKEDDLWIKLVLLVDDFWSHEILYFDNGFLCLRRKDQLPIFPFYSLVLD